MGLVRYPYKRFDGGLNLLDGPLALDNNEAQDLLNMSVTERGTLYRRSGLTQFDDDSLTGAPEHLYPWYPPGKTQVLAASIDGDIYFIATDGTDTLVKDGTAGHTWDFESAERDPNEGGGTYLWAMNGEDTPQKIADDGTASDWAEAPNGKRCLVWRNHMIVTCIPDYPQRVAWSDIGNPESPASQYDIASAEGNWIDIKYTDDEEDPITDARVMMDTLLIFKRRSVWAIYDDETFENIRLGEIGTPGRFMSGELRGEVYYVSDNGIYKVNPNRAPELVSRLISPMFNADYDGDRVAKQYLTKARLIITRDERILVALAAGGSNNSIILEGIPAMTRTRSDGFKEFPWMIHNIAVKSLCIFRPLYDPYIFGGSSTKDKVYQLFSGNSDDGDEIECYWFGPWHGVQVEEPIERIRRINIQMTGSGYTDLYQDLNILSYVFTAPMESVPDPDPLWDGGQWNGGTWNPFNPVNFVRIRPEKRGRYHALKFRNREGSDLKIYSAEMAYRGGKEITK